MNSKVESIMMEEEAKSIISAQKKSRGPTGYNLFVAFAKKSKMYDTMEKIECDWKELSIIDKALWVKKGAAAKSFAVNKVKNRAPGGYNLFVADHSNRVRYDGGSAFVNDE